MSFFDSLPCDMVLEIVDFLDPVPQCLLFGTCRKLNALKSHIKYSFLYDVSSPKVDEIRQYLKDENYYKGLITASSGCLKLWIQFFISKGAHCFEEALAEIVKTGNCECIAWFETSYGYHFNQFPFLYCLCAAVESENLSLVKYYMNEMEMRSQDISHKVLSDLIFYARANGLTEILNLLKHKANILHVGSSASSIEKDIFHVSNNKTILRKLMKIDIRAAAVKFVKLGMDDLLLELWYQYNLDAIIVNEKQSGWVGELVEHAFKRRDQHLVQFLKQKKVIDVPISSNFWDKALKSIASVGNLKLFKEIEAQNEFVLPLPNTASAFYSGILYNAKANIIQHIIENQSIDLDYSSAARFAIFRGDLSAVKALWPKIEKNHGIIEDYLLTTDLHNYHYIKDFIMNEIKKQV
jgi:hypothetical protein